MRSFLKKCTALLSLAAICVSLFACDTRRSARETGENAGSLPDFAPVNSAVEAIAELQAVATDYGYNNALSELSEKNTTTIDGDTYYRLQQNYQGIPVYGKSVVYVTDEDGEELAVTGNVIDVEVGIVLTPTITEEQAQAAQQAYFAKTVGLSESEIAEMAELFYIETCIFLRDGERGRIAYRTTAGCYEIIIDAADGTILFVDSATRNEAAIGYRASDKKQKNGFQIEKESDDCYALINNTLGLIVYDLNKKNSEKFSTETTHYVTSTDNIFGNGDNEKGYESGVDLLENAAKMTELYQEQLGFHTPSGYTILCYNDGYDSGKNAKGGAYLKEGIGLISMGYSTGVNDIDTMGHEYGHVISKTLAGLNHSSTENAAISEGISDIFGELTEAWFYGWRAPDWVMQQENGHKAKRNIANPKKTNCAEKANDKVSWLMEADYFYSTVISHAAYLMWNGIDGDASKKITEEDLLKLWYRAMLMMPADCSFAECRELVELAGISMGFSQKQLRCIGEAFDATGISDGQEVDYELTPEAELCVYGINSELCESYQIEIKGEQIVLKEGVELSRDFREMQKKNNYMSVFERKRYYEQRTVTEQAPVPINLPSGTYTLTVIDSQGSGAEYAFKIRTHVSDGKSTLDIYTDFSAGASVALDGLVTDAYAKDYTYTAMMYNSETDKSEETALTCSFRIPQINLPGSEAERINAEIYQSLQPIAENVEKEIAESGFPMTSDGMFYQWAVNGDLLSLVVVNSSMPEYSGGNEYMVFNLSVSDGNVISDEDVISLAGFSEAEFRETAKQALGSGFWEMWEPSHESFGNEHFVDFFNEQYRRTVSDENIEQSFPYINADGQLCIIARWYSLAGGDYYWHEYNLVSFALSPYWSDEAEVLSYDIHISEEEAYDIACAHWDFTEGDIAEETGYPLYLLSDGLRKEADGKQYYAFRLVWEITEGGYYSTIDWAFVNAETGECTDSV